MDHTTATTAAVNQLDEGVAGQLVYAIADRFGWEVALWTRADVDDQLFSQVERDAGETITDEQ